MKLTPDEIEAPVNYVLAQALRSTYFQTCTTDTGKIYLSRNNMKLVHWPLMGGLLHLLQRGGDWTQWTGPQPATTVHPLTASV